MGNNVKRFMKIWECPKPVLGEVKGWAIGGATDLVMCCDLLYMASDAHIGYAPSRIYGTPTTMMWVYRLGLEHAKQFILTGRAIDADTAYRIGLVSHVCPPDELGAFIEEEARRFRHIPANQLALNKLLINQAFENMGLRTSQLLGTFFDGITRHTEEAQQWVNLLNKLRLEGLRSSSLAGRSNDLNVTGGVTKFNSVDSQAMSVESNSISSSKPATDWIKSGRSFCCC
jgi:enoyl-CoA hydratase